jgi:hypothetical protein
MAKKAIINLRFTQIVFSNKAMPSLLKMKGYARLVSNNRATNNHTNYSINSTLTDINVLASVNTRYSRIQNDIQKVNNSENAIYQDK